MWNEYNKCNFCMYYDNYEGCIEGCNNYEDYKPNKSRIIEKAKEKSISVSDLIALIEL